MDKRIENDLSYVCSLIEYTARKTKNHRSYIVTAIGIEGLKNEMEFAQVNHCLSVEQVSDELIQQYKIDNGVYDTVGICKYDIPSAIDIGKVYMRLIRSIIVDETEITHGIMVVFTSWISEKISDFNSATYYSSSDYLYQSFKMGYLLE